MGHFRNTRGRCIPTSKLSAGSRPQHLQPLRLACNELLLGAVRSLAADMQQYGSGDREQRVLRQPVCWTCLVLMAKEIMVDFLV